MFETPDPQAALDAASALDVTSFTDDLRDAGFLSAECARKVEEHLKPLREFLANRPGDWGGLQKFWGFAHQENRINPMNAANLCPRPTPLVEAINAIRLDYNLNVAQQTRTGTGRRVLELERARQLVAQGLGLSADSKDVALVRNASEGNNLITYGFKGWTKTDDPAKKDNVVIWKDQNHPTNGEAWKMRAHWSCPPGEHPLQASCLFEVREVDLDFSAATDDEVVEAFVEAMTPETRFVAFSETSNVSGRRVPPKAIERIWRKALTLPDCHVHIDGTMTWGARAVDLSAGRRHCHSFTSSAHKWFLGPKETGMLFVAPDRAERLMPSHYAYDYKITVPDDGWRGMPDTALRFEMLGQRDDVNVLSLAFAQMIWTWLQPWEPYVQIERLGEGLRTLLDRDGWKILSPREETRRSNVIWIEEPERAPAKSLYQSLYEDRKFRVGAGGNLTATPRQLRLCPHLYNTLPDIRDVVTAMGRWRSGG